MKTPKSAAFSESLRRDGMGQLGDLDHTEIHDDLDHKGKPTPGHRESKVTKQKADGDRKVRNKGRH